MKTTSDCAEIDILGQQFLVEYEFKITSRGSPESGPSYYSGGEPAEAAEFEIEVFGLRWPKKDADVPEPDMPEWLRDLITTHLSERDDINDIVQDADMHDDGCGDPDEYYDRKKDDA